MDNALPDLTFNLQSTIADIPADDWDGCAGFDNPFVSHAFLDALEKSGSASARTGWLPRHVVLKNADGRIVAVAPVYIKAHSYGEYVFDHAWADAFERAGGDYYPKLQCAVPFSPVPGPRLLWRKNSGITPEDLGAALLQITRNMKLSSAHITFCTEEEYQKLGERGWLQRLGVQFHWQNKGYQSFDDFLAALSSRHRKNIRRERQAANDCGLIYKTLSGKDIQEHHWDAFYAFYRATIDRKWGSAYLTRDFFSLLSQNLGDKIVLMMAKHDGRPIAGALNLRGADTLYGRNWGCVGEWPFLHFELCYYRAIDYAVAHGLRRVEAGAQGQHKIQRGYLPELTYSAHWISHQGLSNAVDSFLQEERRGVMEQKEALAELSPFKRE